MTLQEIYNTPAVKEIEIEILTLQNAYERKVYSGPEGFTIEHLLDIRKHILDSMFVMDEHYKQLLSEFNDAMRQQLIEMRKRTISLYEAVSEKGPEGEVEVVGKCFLGYGYSKIHPIQTMRAKKMWAVLNGSLDCYIPLYRDGIVDFRISNRGNGTTPTIASENEMLYLDKKWDNWNEGLDSELTQDMHLVYPFHNLFCHMNFSIFDLLWVRDFNLEICAELDSSTYEDDDSGDDIDWDKCDYFD